MVKYKFLGLISFSALEIRNLLNEDYEATMADSAIFYDQYQLGTSVSLGFKVSF